MLPARRTPMKRALALLAIFLVLFTALLVGPAWAGGSWHHGPRGGHGSWRRPGARIRGPSLGGVGLAAHPLCALPPPPAPGARAPPACHVQTPAYAVPPAAPPSPPDP